MQRYLTDIRLYIGLLLAHGLMYFTFQDNDVFWYIFTATILLLISFAIVSEKIEDNASFFTYLTFGVISGAALFSLFWIGNVIFDFFNLAFSKNISTLYNRFAPSLLWHYIVLILIIIPGEEIFWRGFIQKRLLSITNTTGSIIISSLLYASVHLYSGFFIHVFAALVAGLFWGFLYSWKKSLPLVIVSHLVFDLFIFVLSPFN